MVSAFRSRGALAQARRLVAAALLLAVASAQSSAPSEAPSSAPTARVREGNLRVLGNARDEAVVEVFFRGEWGKVCAGDFGITDALILCQTLLFEGGINAAPAAFSPGDLLWVTSTQCSAASSDFFSCVLQYGNGATSGCSGAATVTCVGQYSGGPMEEDDPSSTYAGTAGLVIIAVAVGGAMAVLLALAYTNGMMCAHKPTMTRHIIREHRNTTPAGMARAKSSRIMTDNPILFGEQSHASSQSLRSAMTNSRRGSALAGADRFPPTAALP